MTNRIILVATWKGGLFAVTAGRTVPEIADKPVRGLAPDGRGGALAIVGGHELCRRSPGGQWTTIAASASELSCCMAVRDAIYVGTDDARMLRLRDGASVLDPLAGFDSVAGRESWFAGSAIVQGQRVGPPLGVRSVAANADASILFANVHVGGIPRSLDGGATWQPTLAVETDVHQVCGHPEDPAIVVAAAAVGLCISRDAGATWAIDAEGLHAPHCAAVAISGSQVLVSAAQSPFVAEARLYRRPLRPNGLLAPVEGMPLWTSGLIDTSCLAVAGASIAGVDRAGNLYLSQNFAQAWTCTPTGLSAPSGVLFC